MRFYHITQNQFFYFDEGMWLLENQKFISLVDQNPPKNLSELGKILGLSAQFSIPTAKALWAFIASLRGLFVGEKGYYFVRLVSAIFGSLTLVVIYFLSKRFYNSSVTALLSVAILAVLPSHIYYSRIGLQEAFSTFLFISAFYLYFSSKKIHFNAFLAGFLFAAVYFSNYRMIIAPFVIGFAEIYLSLARKQSIDYKKFICCFLTFVFLVIAVGSLYNWINFRVTFGWIFHQKDLSKGTFDFINLFSYPYYLFKLESIIFGILLLSSIYLLIKRKWIEAFPFLFVCLFMALFSFSQEKGVRYVTAVMPFMAIAVAVMCNYVWKESSQSKVKIGIIILVLLMGVDFVYKDNAIIHFKNDYQVSIEDIRRQDPQAKFISTQEMVQKLYVSDANDVVGFKKDFQSVVLQYSKGYNYLIVDPQAFVSLTYDQKRFTFKLVDYLDFISNNVMPIRIYNHFNEQLFERFVLEHNENLRTSIQFIHSHKDKKLGLLKVYDFKICLGYLKQKLDVLNKNKI